MRLHGLALSFGSTKQAPRLAQDFLRATSGLQYLNLCYAPAISEVARLDTDCLVGHCYSIKDLYLGIGSNHAQYARLHVLSQDDLEWIVTECLSLRQLALALPAISFDEVFAGIGADYGVALVRNTMPASTFSATRLWLMLL